jgi:hypothetical protein
MGADQTTLARLSASLEEEIFGSLEAPESHDDLAQIEAAFARRNQELAKALKQGRQWFGIIDTLPERLALAMTLRPSDIWTQMPKVSPLSEESIFMVGEESAVEPPLFVPVLAEEPAQDQLQVKAQPVDSQEDTAPTKQTTAPTMSVVSPVSEPTTPAPLALIFGDEEAIKRARKQRGTRSRRTMPRLKNPVTVKDIPAALIESESSKGKQPETEIVVTSLWEDLSFSEGDDASVA